MTQSNSLLMGSDNAIRNTRTDNNKAPLSHTNSIQSSSPKCTNGDTILMQRSQSLGNASSSPSRSSSIKAKRVLSNSSVQWNQNRHSPSFRLEGEVLPDIVATRTFGSSDDDDDSESEIVHSRHSPNNSNAESIIADNPPFDSEFVIKYDETNSMKKNVSPLALSSPQHSTDATKTVEVESWPDILHNAMFISSYGIIGTVVRCYIGRFFGLDCEMKSLGHSVDDFFQSISSNICVTSSGKTEQTGGAVFVDLPANMLGSFIMGLISPPTGHHTIPWFRSDHRLQNNKHFHDGLRVGTCGCLTTFSSWNTQMVVMMDGTGTVLGSQIVSALFGYIIGMACSLSSFNFGRTVAEWVRRIHATNDETLPTIELQDTQATDSYSKHDKKRQQRRFSANTVLSCATKLFCVQNGAHLVAILLFVAFVVADFVSQMETYRAIWLSLLFSPLGSILRWRLSRLNAYGIPKYNMKWFPVGTFLCNVVAAAVSITAQAVQLRLDNSATRAVWTLAILSGTCTGFSGSMSTVSTLVREMADATPVHALIYGVTTIVCSCVVGIILYRPIAG